MIGAILYFCYVTLFDQGSRIYVVGRWINSMQGLAILFLLAPIVAGIIINLMMKKRERND